VGETAADTARELDALRGETERLLDALEGRARRVLDVERQVEANRPLVMALGAGAAILAGLTVLLLWYRSYRRAQEARRPINRLRRGAEAVREEATARARGVGRALRGEWAEDEAATREQQKAQEVGLPQRLAGAAAAAATMALVDQFTRWLAKQQTTGVEHSQAAAPPEPPAPSPPPAPPTA
jgi:hypothetical protein